MVSFKLGSIIDQGGFCQIFQATRQSDGLECVIKQPIDASDKESSQRFKREVRIMKNLVHKNIVPILGSGLDAKPPWYAMPKAIMSLDQLLKESHGEELSWIFEEILGLFATHIRKESYIGTLSQTTSSFFGMKKVDVIHASRTLESADS